MVLGQLVDCNHLSRHTCVVQFPEELARKESAPLWPCDVRHPAHLDRQAVGDVRALASNAYLNLCKPGCVSPRLALGNRGSDHGDLIGVLAEVGLEQAEYPASRGAARRLFGEKINSLSFGRDEQHRPVLPRGCLVVLDLSDRVAGIGVDNFPRLSIRPHPQIEQNHPRRVTRHLRNADPSLSPLIVRVGRTQAFRPGREEVQTSSPPRSAGAKLAALRFRF